MSVFSAFKVSLLFDRSDWWQGSLETQVLWRAHWGGPWPRVEAEVAAFRGAVPGAECRGAPRGCTPSPPRHGGAPCAGLSEPLPSLGTCCSLGGRGALSGSPRGATWWRRAVAPAPGPREPRALFLGSRSASSLFAAVRSEGFRRAPPRVSLFSRVPDGNACHIQQGPLRGELEYSTDDAFLVTCECSYPVVLLRPAALSRGQGLNGKKAL